MSTTTYVFMKKLEKYLPDTFPYLDPCCRFCPVLARISSNFRINKTRNSKSQIFTVVMVINIYN